MTTAKARKPLEEAQAIAEEVKAAIADVCTSVVIAGSVRRKKAEVGDIELVCIPSYATTIPAGELFPRNENQLEARLRAMAGGGSLIERYKEDGTRVAWFKKGKESRYIAAAYKEKIGVDFFIILPDRLDWYGWHLLLRTGPSDANQLLMTEKMHGGWLPRGMKVADGIIYREGKPCPVEDEAAFFELWGFHDFIPASERSVERYREALKR